MEFALELIPGLLFLKLSVNHIVVHASSSSESTWQNILKSVFATIVSTSQFVKSQGIDDVASRLQGLIDGVIESSNANHEQLNHEASNQKPHPANTNESQNSNK